MRAPVLSRVVSRRLRLLSYAVLAILLAIAALVAAATLPVLFGYHTYVVNGGSMEPSLKSGSVAVAKETSPFALEVGDVIARREQEDGPAVLHRIVRITDDETGRLLYTQGDANRTADPEPVMFLGTGDKVIYSVPYVGYILNFGGSTPGHILLLGTPLVLLAAISLYEKSPLRRRRQEATASATVEPAESPITSPREATPAEPIQEDEGDGPPRLRIVAPSIAEEDNSERSSVREDASAEATVESGEKPPLREVAPLPTKERSEGPPLRDVALPDATEDLPVFLLEQLRRQRDAGRPGGDQQEPGEQRVA